MVLTPGVVDAVRGDVHGEGSDGALELVGFEVVEARHRPCVGAPRAGKHAKKETTGAQEGRKKKIKKKTQQQPQTGQPQPGGGRTSKERTKTGQRKGEAHQNASGRPARPTRPSRARTRTHARDPGVASSDPKGAVSASTRNSPGAPAESPVERRAVRETGRVSDRVHTRQTPPRTQPKTDAGGTRQGQPHRGAPNGYDAERASAPASAGASGRHNEPGSRPASACPAQPPSKSGGASSRVGERHHGDGKANRSTESDRTGRGAAHQRGATRHAREARRRPQPRHEDRCQATTATGCRKPGQRAQHTMNHGTGTGARQQPTHTPHTPARSGGAQPKPGARAHTPTTHTPARSGGVQEEHAHQHTHTQKPQPGVAGRSRNPSPSTHTHTAHPSQEWRGTRRARTQACQISEPWTTFSTSRQKSPGAPRPTIFTSILTRPLTVFPTPPSAESSTTIECRRGWST